MGIQIDPERCTGCGACVDVCPGDSLSLVGGYPRLRSAGECWFCLSCAKACPQGAIAGRLPFVLADPGASLWPEVEGDGMQWFCRHADGQTERFQLQRGEVR